MVLHRHGHKVLNYRKKNNELQHKNFKYHILLNQQLEVKQDPLMSYLCTSGWIKELNDFSTDGGKATEALALHLCGFLLLPVFLLCFGCCFLGRND